MIYSWALSCVSAQPFNLPRLASRRRDQRRRRPHPRNHPDQHAIGTSRHDERRARQHDRRPCPGKRREYPGCHQRGDDRRQPLHRGQRPLRLTLPVRRCSSRDQPLYRWTGDRSHRLNQDPHHHDPAKRRQPDAQIRTARDRPADHCRSAFAQPRNDASHQQSLHHRGPQPGQRQRYSVMPRIPTEPSLIGQHKGALQRPQRKPDAAPGDRQPTEVAARHHHVQRTQRTGSAPVDRPAAISRQTFRQHQQPVQHVAAGQRRCSHEGNAQPVGAQQATQRRSNHETNAERGANEPKLAGALLRRRHVSDVGCCRRRVRGRRPGD